MAPPSYLHLYSLILCLCNHICRQLEVCLEEVENSQLFVGILGSRYGYVPPNYNLPDHPHFRWVRQTLGLEQGLGRKQFGVGVERNHSVSGTLGLWTGSSLTLEVNPRQKTVQVAKS